MEILNMLLQGLAVSLIPANFLACIGGVLIGTLVGMLPGIGPIGAISMLMTISLSMDTGPAMIMFAGICYGAMYGGSTSSILLNIPGEAASVVTCIEGHEMAKRGRAGAALAISAIGSFIAGTIGLIGLTIFAPILAESALNFGPAEYFAISVFGLTVLSKLTGGSMLKSGLMVTLGVIFGTFGDDCLTAAKRFAFVPELLRGIELPLLAMGIFGVAEILDTMIRPKNSVRIQDVRWRDLYPNMDELRRAIAPIFRGGIIGFIAGLIPGPALSMSTFMSYTVEKRISKTPEAFGTGVIEGVAGPESANNAAASASMIPLLSLGLPFCPTTGMLLSGFVFHGVSPGPSMIVERPGLFWGLIVSMYIGNMLLLVINLPLLGMFTSILRTPLNILMPLILILTLTGAYTINNSIFDLYLVSIFGIVGFFMKRTGFSPAPLLIGLILGPTMERGLVQGLIISNGNFVKYFLLRPISGTILALTVLLIIYNMVSWLRKIKHGNKDLGNLITEKSEPGGI